MSVSRFFTLVFLTLMLVSNGADAFLYPVRRKAPLHQALQASLADQLGLSERFDRWRFLQKVLDEEVAAEPTNQLLFQVLEGYLKYPRPVVAGSDLTGSPERTLERVQRVADVVQRAAGETSIPLVSDINDDDDNDENNNLDIHTGRLVARSGGRGRRPQGYLGYPHGIARPRIGQVESTKSEHGMEYALFGDPVTDLLRFSITGCRGYAFGR